MGELRIDRARQSRLQLVDLFCNGPEPLNMAAFVAPARLVANNCQPFAQGGNKIDNHGFHQLKAVSWKLKLETAVCFKQACSDE
jgi:hypothetical protein